MRISPTIQRFPRPSLGQFWRFVVTSGVVGAGLVVGGAPAHAAAPSLTVPGRVYPAVGTILTFSGTDPISGDPRALQASGLAELATCDPTAGNNYSIVGCPRIQMSLTTTKAGLLRLPDNTAITNLDASPDVDVIVNSTGVVVEATDSHGLDSQTFNFNGHPADVQATLAKIQFVPCSAQQGTDRAPNDASDNEFEVECGLQMAPTPEPGAYEEKESADGMLPKLQIQAVNPGANGAASPQRNISIKVEGTNDAPSLVTPVGPMTAAAGATTTLADLIDADDADMCSKMLCPAGVGDPVYDNDPLVTHQEGDDKMLLAVWLAESNCGAFDIQGDNFFTEVGGATTTSIHALLRGQTGLDLNDAEQDVAADAIAAAIESSLSPTVLALDLSAQNAAGTKVFAGVGGIDDVRYSLSKIDFIAPAAEGTCHLNVAVSDLGNNGAPLAFVGSPEGPELPYIGHTVDLDNDPNTAPTPGDDVPYEVPNALSASTSVTLNVKDTHPDVTITQTLPTALGDPAGPNKPSGFTITFGEPIDPASFTGGDLSLGTSTAPNAAAGPITAVTPGLAYVVPVTATGDGTITLTMAAGAVCAAGHFNATCDAGYASATPVYADHQIAWDQTAAKVTIEQQVTQADPTSTSPVEFTATFDEAVVGFTTDDLSFSGTTAGGSLLATITGGPTSYDIAVSGMTTAGNVVVSVKAGAVVDGAANPSSASTSTDNVVQFEPPAPVTVSTPGGDASMVVGSGGQLVSFSASTPAVPPPSDLSFPFGQFSFTATTSPNGLVTFVLTLPSAPIGYHKLVGSAWEPFTWDGVTGAQINGNVVTITIQDNGRGDSDPTPGVATDPGAPVFAVIVPDTTIPEPATTDPAVTTTETAGTSTTDPASDGTSATVSTTTSTTASRPGDQALPETGSNVGGVLTLAATLLAAGLAALVRARRPRAAR